MELKLILQIVGTLLGLLYLYLEYKANIFLWIVGMVMPIVHGFLYYKSGLYADSAMQIYYVMAGFYGWLVWMKGAQKTKKLAITHTPAKNYMGLLVLYAGLHAFIYLILINFTNSNVPFLDSMTTALCIVAYWMLSRKYVEQWLVWLVVDAITVGLYIYKGIPITAMLYMLYTGLAVAGYFRWLKMMRAQND